MFCRTLRPGNEINDATGFNGVNDCLRFRNLQRRRELLVARVIRYKILLVPLLITLKSLLGYERK